MPSRDVDEGLDFVGDALVRGPRPNQPASTAGVLTPERHRLTHPSAAGARRPPLAAPTHVSSGFYRLADMLTSDACDSSLPWQRWEYWVVRAAPSYRRSGRRRFLVGVLAGTTVMLSWNPPSSGAVPTGYVVDASLRQGAHRLGVCQSSLRRWSYRTCRQAPTTSASTPLTQMVKVRRPTRSH